MNDTTFETTRDALHRVAAHVLARRRHAVSGNIQLRPTPGGFGAPAFGPDDRPEIVRLAGTTLVREVGDRATATPLAGASLVQLAAAVDVDLDPGFSVGPETPALGDVEAPIEVDAAAAAVLAGWFDLGQRILDVVYADAVEVEPAWLWPEHFDVGSSVLAGAGRCNLGASPGDGFHPQPYLYVGPWGPDRPGDAAYWNAPFGAVLGRADALAADDPVAAGVAFMRRGLDRLAG